MNSNQLKDKLEQARYFVAEYLNSSGEKWAVENGVVKGPEMLEVRVEDHHMCGDTHLDIGFVLNRERHELPVLWDCVAGLGTTQTEGISRAIETWAISTLPVYQEFLARDGSFADHFHANDPQGCVGWHVIHGPLIAYGVASAPDVLQAWALETPLLSLVGPVAAKAFGRDSLNCVKMMFGFGDDDIAEVRVNGEVDQAASDYLKSLPWPRSDNAAFARCYLLFVHQE